MIIGNHQTVSAYGWLCRSRVNILTFAADRPLRA